jgi:hypothetical protein
MLREAKKIKKEHRASLQDARTRVAELETQNLVLSWWLPWWYSWMKDRYGEPERGE